MLKLALATAFLTTQLLLADVVVTDNPNQRFIVVFDSAPGFGIKECLSLPDEGKPRRCEEQPGGIPINYTNFQLMNDVEKALTSELTTKNLSEASTNIAKIEIQMSAKRVMNMAALSDRKTKLELEQTRHVTLERFNRALLSKDDFDFEIDVDSKVLSEVILAKTIVAYFDSTRTDKAKKVAKANQDLIAAETCDFTATYQSFTNSVDGGTPAFSLYSLGIHTGESTAMLEVRHPATKYPLYIVPLKCTRSGNTLTCTGSDKNRNFEISCTKNEAVISVDGSRVGELEPNALGY